MCMVTAGVVAAVQVCCGPIRRSARYEKPASQEHNLNTAAMAFRVIKQRREARRAAKLEEIFTVRQD